MTSIQSITTWTFEPFEPLRIARRYAHIEGTALLYSGGSFDSAQVSFLCLFPEKQITLSASPESWEELQRTIGACDNDGLSIPQWVGYLGYEMGSCADPDKTIPYATSCLPDCCFYQPGVVIRFDHRSRLATLYARSCAVKLEKEAPCGQPESSLYLAESSDTLETYLEKIAQIKEWILDGEIYQVNLSQQFVLEGESHPFTLFEKIVQLNPAPFSAYLQCGDFSIVSSSPERLLRKQGDRLETRPIKGTMPRGATAYEDDFNREALLHSEKERAELLMITDLMRSDVGKVSLPGTVKTREIWRCEAYSNVFHLLSIIEGRAIAELHPVALVRSLFPGGSITGCPKLRAMEAIEALEKRPRGIYTGSIGYFSANGDFDFNIAIRTLIVHPRSIRIQLGGAIVIDSNPVREFEETLHKGRSLFKVLGVNEINGHCLL